MSDIEELQRIIRELHGTDSTHVETVPIREPESGQAFWEGEVEVFDLHGHPKANRVYAWSHETEDADSPKRHVTILHIEPATSPRKAVQAAIVAEYRAHEHSNEN